MEAKQRSHTLDHRRHVILRPAVASDATAFETFDLGDTSAFHLTEVAEIVRQLWSWICDPSAAELDRRVHVAEDHGTIVGVVAHHLLVGESGTVIAGHRYLMVVAIQQSCQRDGYATAILEALFDRMRATGVSSVEWLVHPANHASIQFSNRSFPMAEETSPPDSKPYLPPLPAPALPGDERAKWSGWGDLNSRPPRPERGALPSCATPRWCPTMLSGGCGLFLSRFAGPLLGVFDVGDDRGGWVEDVADGLLQ